MTNAEFEALLRDESKQIHGDLAWVEDEDHSPTVEFRAEVVTDAGYPLFVRGSLNRLAGKLTFAMIHRGVGCIYRLDLGQEHHNPSCQMVGETHKHRWTEQLRDKEAYRAPDIRSDVSDPRSVWQEFCAEARLAHSGNLLGLPPLQEELF